MPDTEDDFNAKGFLRQRRNLQITSSLLVVFYLAGVDIKTVKLGPIDFTDAVERPWVFILLLWSALIYFFLRYLVYMKHMNGYQKYLRSYERAEKEFANTYFAKTYLRDGMQIQSMNIDRRDPAFTFKFRNNVEVDGRTVNHLTIKKPSEIRKIRFNAIRKSLLNDISFLEFVFPLLFAVMPLLALLVTDNVFLVLLEFLESCYSSIVSLFPSKIELTIYE